MTITGRAFHEHPAFLFGDAVQRAFGKYLANQESNTVIPLHTWAAEGGPCMFGGGESIVAPDFLYFRRGTFDRRYTTFYDVKAKKAPSFNFRRQRWEHGIDYSAAMEYARVQDRTGIPVTLVIYEHTTPEDACIAPLAKLTGTAGWRWIRLNDVLTYADHREDWPGGAADPTRLGRRRQGGLLWNRDDMCLWLGIGEP